MGAIPNFEAAMAVIADLEKANERCYDAGWSDMKAAASNLLRWEGHDELADRLELIEKPPSGDK